ncbi:MAG TPA: hypothetical protein P5120_18455 [Spirochaetota bacterium]|nr:hypothetical protein [Spirochaetota bacterium]
MDRGTCPTCGKEPSDKILFKCVRCFTVYCKECPETSSGYKCPKCGMSQRLILTD